MAKSPTGPAGIAQLTRGSARELALRPGRRIRIGSKAVKKTRWVGTGKNRRKVVQTVQQPVYKTLDERYVPERAIMAMARRLSNRRSWLGGRVDFAVAEYHMGAGRMAGLLSAYFGRTLRVSDVPAEMRGRIFLTRSSTGRTRRTTAPPYTRRSTISIASTTRRRTTSACGRRCACSRRTASRPTHTPRWRRPIRAGSAGRCCRAGSGASSASRSVVRCLPRRRLDVGERFVLLPDIASVFGVRAIASAMSAERSTIGSALFVAHHLKRLQGERYSGFEIARMLAPPSPAALASAWQAPDRLKTRRRIHCTRLGWAFDVPSAGLSRIDQRDLKFILTDLRQAGLLAYVEDGRQPTFHVVRHPDHAQRFEQFYRDVMAGNLPAEQPSVARVD